MPTKLAQAEINGVRNAILATFVTAPQLRAALVPILQTVDANARPGLALEAGQYRETIRNLVATWNGQGLIADLIGGLQRAAPHSPELRRFQMVRLANSAAGIESVELQGFLTPWLGHLPAAGWIEELRARMRAVCRIELAGYDPPAVGTGFLVGPDLVLTAYHVAEPVKRQPLLADDAVCRFEYFDDATRSGTAVHLRRPKTIEVWSLPGANERAAGGAEPKSDELDYALLRLKTRVDVEPFRPAPNPALVNDPLVVLQHPRRAPLRISFGRVTGFNAPGTRLRHAAATEQGSSGAPCLNQDLQLVGLHNAARYVHTEGLADYNTAVPITSIAVSLTARGFSMPSAVERAAAP